MLQQLFGTQLDMPVKIALALIVIAALLGLTVVLMRRLGGGRDRPFAPRGRQQRRSIIDSVPVDQKRSLVLVRRDEVEHLLLVGGTSDLVVEQNIDRREQAAPQRASKASRRFAPAPSLGEAELAAPEEAPALAAPEPAPLPLPEPRPALEPRPVIEPRPVLEPRTRPELAPAMLPAAAATAAVAAAVVPSAPEAPAVAAATTEKPARAFFGRRAERREAAPTLPPVLPLPASDTNDADEPFAAAETGSRDLAASERTAEAKSIEPVAEAAAPAESLISNEMLEGWDLTSPDLPEADVTEAVPAPVAPMADDARRAPPPLSAPGILPPRREAAAAPVRPLPDLAAVRRGEPRAPLPRIDEDARDRQLTAGLEAALTGDTDVPHLSLADLLDEPAAEAVEAPAERQPRRAEPRLTDPVVREPALREPGLREPVLREPALREPLMRTAPRSGERDMAPRPTFRAAKPSPLSARRDPLASATTSRTEGTLRAEPALRTDAFKRPEPSLRTDAEASTRSEPSPVAEAMPRLDPAPRIEAAPRLEAAPAKPAVPANDEPGDPFDDLEMEMANLLGRGSSSGR